MFGVTKPPKSQKPDNAPLYFYRFHTKEVENYNAFWKENYRQFAIFDIGYENLCRRISRRYFYPKKVEPLAYDKTSVRVETDEKDFRILFRDVEIWLDLHREEYFRCHVIIVEWQLPVNYKAVRISTFILSYFHFLLKDAPLLPLILEMRSGFKDDYFPVLKPLNQNARKSMCEELGRQLLELQGDTYSLEIMRNGKSKRKKKQDDYADTVLMEEVFCRFAYEKGWNFPHYENAKKITIRRIEAEKNKLDDENLILDEDKKGMKSSRRTIQAIVRPRPPAQNDTNKEKPEPAKETLPVISPKKIKIVRKKVLESE